LSCHFKIFDSIKLDIFTKMLTIRDSVQTSSSSKNKSVTLTSIHKKMEEAEQRWNIVHEDLKKKCKIMTPSSALNFHADFVESCIFNAHDQILLEYREMLSQLIHLIEPNEKYIQKFSNFASHLLTLARDDIESTHRGKIDAAFVNIRNMIDYNIHINEMSNRMSALNERADEAFMNVHSWFEHIVLEIDRAMDHYFVEVEHRNSKSLNPIAQQTYHVTMCLTEIIQCLQKAKNSHRVPHNQIKRHDTIMDHVMRLRTISFSLFRFINNKCRQHGQNNSPMQKILEFADGIDMYEHMVSKLSSDWLLAVWESRAQIGHYAKDHAQTNKKCKNVVKWMGQKNYIETSLSKLENKMVSIERSLKNKINHLKNSAIKKMNQINLDLHIKTKKPPSDLNCETLSNVLLVSHSEFENTKDILREINKEQLFNKKMMDHISEKEKRVYEIEEGYYESKNGRPEYDYRVSFYKPLSDINDVDRELIHNYWMRQDTYKSYESQPMFRDRFFSTERENRIKEKQRLAGIKAKPSPSTEYFVYSLMQEDRKNKNNSSSLSFEST